MPTIRSCNSPALLIVCLLIFCTLYYKSKVEIGFTEHSSPLRRFDQPTGTWPFQVLKKNDSFEVLLFYSVKSKHVPRLTVPENQVLQNGTSKKNLSFDDLVKIPDSYWKLPIHIDVTRTYPQAIDVVDATNRLMNGDPLYEDPINLAKFRYLKMSGKVCHPASVQSHDLDIVIVVKSGVGNFKRRRRFRRFYKSELKHNRHTIMSEKFELFFAIGLPRYHIRSRNHNAKERWNPGEFRNEESYKAAKRYLADEMEMNDDLLVGDFEDSYRNLSRKMQFFFTWAATFCRRSRPTFLFIDDDTPFSLKNLITAIHSLKGSQRSHLLHGVLANASVVQREVYRRPNKWSMLKVELPWPIYTPYLFGYYTLIGFDQIEKLALGMLFTRPFSVDDAWFGLVAARMGLRLHLIDEIITKDKILSTQTRFRKLH